MTFVKELYMGHSADWSVQTAIIQSLKENHYQHSTNPRLQPSPFKIQGWRILYRKRFEYDPTMSLSGGALKNCMHFHYLSSPVQHLNVLQIPEHGKFLIKPYSHSILYTVHIYLTYTSDYGQRLCQDHAGGCRERGFKATLHSTTLPQHVH